MSERLSLFFVLFCFVFFVFNYVLPSTNDLFDTYLSVSVIVFCSVPEYSLLSD